MSAGQDAPLAPRYGRINHEYVATWPGRPADEAMWALNLMKYRERADYLDGRHSTLTGVAADDLYTPLGPLKQIGARIVLVGVVTEQLTGDDVSWDRIAIVRYPRRSAMTEMEAMPSFRELHVHKEAGMQTTIVAATFPVPGTVSLPLQSPSPEGSLLLLQLVASDDAPDIATGTDAVPIADFDVEGVIIGDGRSWAKARWHVVAPTGLDPIRAAAAATSDRRYDVVVTPWLNELAVSCQPLRR